MSNRLEFQTVVLAALLHDLGKLLQRGRTLPFDVEGPHPEVSLRFVSAFSDTFKQVADLELLKTLVLCHHRGHRFSGLKTEDVSEPRARLLAYLVNKADGLSAKERGQHAAQWQDFKTTPLASVFLRVFASRDQAGGANYHPSALTTSESLSDALFPVAFENYKSGELEEALRVFGNKAKPLLKVMGEDFDSLLSHLLALLATHTWCIPADTQEMVPDVSLYDHLKTTAAIAACLYLNYDIRDSWEEASKPPQPGEFFYLLVGDISGIQRYVFDIASAERVGGGVAKRLRARSLFVQLISEVAPLQVLEQFHLPITNIIMSSGGKFYLLLPNLLDTEKCLQKYQERVDRWFLQKFQGTLGLNLAWLPFGETEMGTGFGEVLSRVMERLAERKEQAFRRSLVADTGWISDTFVLPSFKSGERPCRSCGKFPAEAEDFCQYCTNDLQWGVRLPKAKYIGVSLKQVRGERELLQAGVSLSHCLGDLKNSPSLVVQINDPDTLPSAKSPASFRYLVNYVPRGSDGQVLDFEEIAGKSHGRPYLAFMKADVDRLGEVLAFGLRGDKDSRWDTVSRLATLSRQLDLFFTGWVEHLLETKFRDCYAVFSGGDDLFLVGPWDCILELVGCLRQDFAEYTCHNPELALSAGVVIAPHHYPISQAAHDVEEAIEKSKSQPEKNCLTLLGHTLTWTEWAKVKADWERLRKEVREEEVSSAFLYSLRDYGEMWRNYQNGNVLGLRFQPLLAYNLKRNVDQRKNPEMYEWAKRLVDWRPGDETLARTLDNLSLLAQLLILWKWKGGEK